jgi:hypothetical protein
MTCGNSDLLSKRKVLGDHISCLVYGIYSLGSLDRGFEPHLVQGPSYCIILSRKRHFIGVDLASIKT